MRTRIKITEEHSVKQTFVVRHMSVSPEFSIIWAPLWKTILFLVRSKASSINLQRLAAPFGAKVRDIGPRLQYSKLYILC